MRVLLLLLVGVLGACQSTPIAMDLGSPVVSNAQGATREGVVPLRGVSRVSMHADRVLRMEPSCAQILKLGYSSNINYSEAIIGLRNRARVMGGNAIAVVGWAETASASAGSPRNPGPGSGRGRSASAGGQPLLRTFPAISGPHQRPSRSM